MMHFFQRASSFLVIIPLALMAYIVLTYGNANKSNLLTSPSPTSTQSKTLLPTPEQTPYVEEGIKSLFAQVNAEMAPSREEALSPQSAPATPTFDFEGPWVCENNSLNLYVKEKKIKVAFVDQQIQKHVLVNGDCAYEWSANNQGVKQCGIGTYIDMLAPFISSDPSKILQIIKAQQNDISAVDVDSVLASCKKLPVDDALFTVPQGINWTDQGNGLF